MEPTDQAPMAPASRRPAFRAVAFAAAIGLHFWLRFAAPAAAPWPLAAVLLVGAPPALLRLGRRLAAGQLGSDLLGGLAIATAALLGQLLAGAIIVLMMTGGEALENLAMRRASSVLLALARRMPVYAHRKTEGGPEDIPVADLRVGDVLVLLPHEICPVDGVVIEGRGAMDESFLTGEPFRMIKTVGSAVLSGAVNGEAALAVRTVRAPADSRYAKIMEVMRRSEAERPELRRLADALAAWYTPLSVAIASLAWLASGDVHRFLAVLVIATPCPLLIAIPVAVIGSISLCARRSIIVKTPAVLEQVSECRTAIFDKTGTLTYGEPTLAEVSALPGADSARILGLTAGLERYSRHPLARAVIAEAERRALPRLDATEVEERPGRGLSGQVDGARVRIGSRAQFEAEGIAMAGDLPAAAEGLECAVAVDGRAAAVLRFRDAPRSESRSFVAHLAPRHRIDRVMVVSGDRPSEVRYLADAIGVAEVHAQKTPEEKLRIVQAETRRAKTLYVGDGLNDAPAMTAATVGIAIGRNSEVTSEAASVVVMDNSLARVDEFLHISRRMRVIALQSAVGGMALSLAGMAVAAAGGLSPVQGAVAQEIIDVLAILNALRAAAPPRLMSDFSES